ncbi:MAG: PD40 domain-containing protein [Deltaproteobacteria bacterium]|nr:PD40 domain-containing protein [Deltaproteobacteria bacterium]
MLRTLLKSFAFGLIVTFAQAAEAATYDPELDWRTLQTPHFNITFHQGEEQLADELTVIAETAWDVLTVDMALVPRRRVEVVLVDSTDVANGFAYTLPVNTIVLYVTAPQEGSGLALYEDWLAAVFTHELAHILHLDNLSGLPGVLGLVMGRIISVNRLSPLWMIEGQATFMETRHTTGGRGRNPHSDMILRMATLEGSLPPLGAMDGFMSGPPGGNTRYLFGQSLLDSMVRHSSDDALTRWNTTYGAWILPYMLPGRQVFGQSFHAAYATWEAELEARYAAQRDAVMAEGLTLPIILTQIDGSCYGPSFSPRGDHLVFSCNDRDLGSAIWLANGEGGEAEVLLQDRAAKAFTWRPDGRAFAWSSTHVVNDFNLYEDIYLHKLGEDGATRLTSGARARDPAFSPDGERLLVITNDAQNNDLALLRVDQSLTPLTQHTDHTQLSTPAFSPDGRYVAMSVWQDGARDIWLYRADGQPHRRITFDGHTDRDPTFSPDGRYLLFSSDRDGIPNLYAVDLAEETLFQVTNVLGGAFQPAIHPDGKVLVYQHYQHIGYQIALIPFDPSSWRALGALPLPVEHRGALKLALPGGPPVPDPPIGGAEPLTQTKGVGGGGGGGGAQTTSAVHDQPASGAGVDDVTATDLNRVADESYAFSVPVRPYRAISTALPPRYVLPTVYSTGFGLLGALSTSGTDSLRRWIWGANLTYRTDNGFVGGGASITTNRWRPIGTLAVSATTVPFNDIYVEEPLNPGANVPMSASTNTRYWEVRNRLGASVTYQWRERSVITARYSALTRAPLEELPKDVDASRLPPRGLLSGVGVGLRYSRSRAYARSVSPEGARYAALNIDTNNQVLGSYLLDENDARVPFNQLQITGQLREYVELPGASHHVLALWASGGASIGDDLQYGSFRLGGSYGESPFYQLPEDWRPLRGFPPAVDGGDSYYLLSAELRAPIRVIDWGPSFMPTPLFLKNLHGAAFVDVGDAFFTLDGAAAPRVGAGAELRVDAVVGWAALLSVRLGWGVAVVGSGGYGPLDPGAFYARIGSSF